MNDLSHIRGLLDSDQPADGARSASEHASDRKLARGIVVAAVALGTLITLSFAAWTWHTRDVQLQIARTTNEGHAIAVAGLAQKIVEDINHTLKVVVEHVRSGKSLDDRSLQSLSTTLEVERAESKHVSNFLIVDRHGRITHATQPAAALVGTSVLEREHFAPYRGPNPPVQSLSRPYPSLVSPSDMRFSVSRRLDLENGEFAGAVFAIIDSRELGIALASGAAFSSRSVALHHVDGTLMTRWPYLHERIGNKAPVMSSRHGTPPQKRTFVGISTLDGVERLISQERLGELPFVVAATLSKEAALEGWSRSLVPLAMAWAVLLVTIAVGTRFSVRQAIARRQAHRALGTDRQRTVRVLDALPIGVGYIDREERITFASREYRRLLLGCAEPAGRTCRMAVGDERYANIAPAVRKALDGEDASFEAPAHAAGHAQSVQHVRFIPDFSDDGSVRGVFSLVEEVTQRRQTERALRQSEAQLQALFDHTPVLMAIKSQDGRWQRANRPYLASMGLLEEDVIGRSSKDLFDSGFAARSETVDRVVLETGIPNERVVEFHTPEGLRTFLEVKFPIPGDDASQIGIVGLDLTDRQRAEDLLREERNLTAAVLDHAGALVVVLDRECRIVRFNRTAERASGWAFEEIRGMFPWDTYLPAGEALRIRQETFDAAIRSTGDESLEYVNDWVHRDGRHVTIRWANTVLRAGDGMVNYVVSVGTDITDHIRIESTLRESEARLREAERMAKLGHWELTFASGQLHWSDEIYRIFEIDANRFDASYEAFLAAVHPDDRDAVNAAYRRSVDEHMPYAITHRLRMPDGRIKHVAEQAETTYDDAGLPVRSIGTVQDVTERVLVQHALDTARTRAEQANAAKTTFLANMSHELRTPVHAILSFARIGMDRCGPEAEASRRRFDRIYTNGTRLLALIEDLLDLSLIEAGRVTYRFGSEDLASIMDAVVAETEPLARERSHAILVDHDASRVLVHADAARLAQVVRNLLTNAIRYTPPGGQITMRTTATGPDAVLEIADNGVGIPESELEAVFEKFHQSTRTQTTAGGTGLGLAICREIALAHGGSITASPRNGGGTVMALRLPLLRNDPAE